MPVSGCIASRCIRGRPQRTGAIVGGGRGRSDGGVVGRGAKATVKAGGETVLSAAGAALVKALNLKTLGLFLVGVIIIAVVCVILVFIGVLSKNGEVAASMALISIVIAVGLAGVLAGGVAFLTHAETRHQAVSFGEAVGFCMKRFLGLFGGTWTLILAVLVVAACPKLRRRPSGGGLSPSHSV